jgi:hypothetical protein
VRCTNHGELIQINPIRPMPRQGFIHGIPWIARGHVQDEVADETE